MDNSTHRKSSLGRPVPISRIRPWRYGQGRLRRSALYGQIDAWRSAYRLVEPRCRAVRTWRPPEAYQAALRLLTAGPPVVPLAPRGGGRRALWRRRTQNA